MAHFSCELRMQNTGPKGQCSSVSRLLLLEGFKHPEAEEGLKLGSSHVRGGSYLR